MKLIGRPPVLENGYPNMAANHRYIANDDGEIITELGRRINGGFNGGGFYFPPPPPIPQVPEEKPVPPMIAEIVNKISSKPPVRETPSSTSSLNICGTTITDFAKAIKNENDPLVLDHLPLKHFLMKKYPWILDVTEVRIRPKGGTMNYIPGTIYFGPLEIHITVSPTHHSELMNEKIERKIREKLYVEMMPLITCLYENNNKDNPYIIFSPSHSETILEYVK